MSDGKNANISKRTSVEDGYLSDNERFVEDEGISKDMVYVKEGDLKGGEMRKVVIESTVDDDCDMPESEIEQKDCVLLLSGGIDSVVLLHFLKYLGYEVYGLTFGFKQDRRVDCARYWACELCEGWRYIDLSDIRELMSSSMVLDTVELRDFRPYKLLPNRSMIMLSLAVGWACRLCVDEVFFGANFDDYERHSDCRQDYVHTLSKAVQLATNSNVVVKAPFLGMKKSDIVRLGYMLDVDFSMTWNCYSDEDYPCGECPGCIERREVFREAGVPDPFDR